MIQFFKMQKIVSNFIDDPFGLIKVEDLFEASLYSSISFKYLNAPLSFFNLNDEEQDAQAEIEDLDEGMIWGKLYDSGFFNIPDYEYLKLNPSADIYLYSFIVESKARKKFRDENDFKEYILKSLSSDKLETADMFLRRE